MPIQVAQLSFSNCISFSLVTRMVIPKNVNHDRHFHVKSFGAWEHQIKQKVKASDIYLWKVRVWKADWLFLELVKSYRVHFSMFTPENCNYLWYRSSPQSALQKMSREKFTQLKVQSVILLSTHHLWFNREGWWSMAVKWLLRFLAFFSNYMLPSSIFAGKISPELTMAGITFLSAWLVFSIWSSCRPQTAPVASEFFLF